MYMNRKGVVFGIRDTWSLDLTLSPIILSALLKFKECSNHEFKGVSNKVMQELFPEAEGFYSGEQLNEGEKVWDAIIDKMIYAFDLKNEPKMSDYHFDFVSEFGDRDEKGCRKMTLTNTNEAEYRRYVADSTLYREKVEEVG